MNLSDMATHICEQVGMNDTDDTSAAKMFLKRRLEMIWNTQLWRASIIEATMNIVSGVCDAANTIWIPTRGTMLLPKEFNSVMAVRQSGHAMNVSTLESFFRTDFDAVSQTGDPTLFQVLRPLAWEFNAQTDISASLETGISTNVRYTTDGISMTTATLTNGVTASDVLQIMNARLSAASSVASLFQSLASGTVQDTNTLIVTGAGQTDLNGTYTKTNDSLWTQTGGAGYTIRLLGSAWNFYAAFDIITIYYTTSATLFPTGPWTSGIGAAPVPTVAYGTTTGSVATTFATIAAGDFALPVRQRIRLTVIPNTDISLRIIGKTHCPELGDYDSVPINDAEPCLMAFARGDMLMRQRQHGKAKLAQQEGSALMAKLASSEAFQQASNHRIIPDSGFGEPTFNHPSHSMPFGY